MVRRPGMVSNPERRGKRECWFESSCVCPMKQNDDVRISIMSQPTQSQDENLARSGGSPDYLASAFAFVSQSLNSVFNRAKITPEKRPTSPTESPSGISNGVSPSPITLSEWVPCPLFSGAYLTKFVVSGPIANGHNHDKFNGVVSIFYFLTSH